jgi:hypothetical protein
MVLTVETAFFDQERVIHRADGGQLGGLVADEQECRVLGREEMVGQRVAHRGGAMAGNADSTVAPRCPLIRIM